MSDDELVKVDGGKPVLKSEDAVEVDNRSIGDDEDMIFEVIRVSGRRPKFKHYSVIVRAWIETESGRDFDETISVSVPKNEGMFDAENGSPEFIEKAKELYMSRLERNPDYSAFGVQSIDDGKDVDECVGKCFKA